MVNWDLEVKNTPAKIANRMTPSGTKVDKNFLRLEKHPREMLKGEATEMFYFNGYRLRVGFGNNDFWVVVEPEKESRPIEIQGLAKLLKHPEQISKTKSKLQQQHLGRIGKGYIDKNLSTSEESLGIRYRLLKPNQDPEKVFDAAMFMIFKPIINTIEEIGRKY